MNEYLKVSDTELRVTKEEVKQSEHTYNLNFLLEQKKTIEAQKASEIAQRDLELKEINELLKQCDLLGIKEVAKEEAIKEVK